ncbi:MAG: hypothetical protein HUN04_11890 [Desulfobacter sp.]|nr:MAG: hypothetical protein HUN04_11890 [Desulfobacter sp.]
MSDIQHVQARKTRIALFDNLDAAGEYAGEKIAQGYSRISVIHTREYLLESNKRLLDIDFDAGLEYIVMAVK